MSNYQENLGPYDGLTVNNAALLLIDHQVGLIQLVRDMIPEELKNSVVGLARRQFKSSCDSYQKYGSGTS